jgi:hypothetical protein
MALDTVALSYPFCQIEDECIEKEPLEEGELEDDSECTEEEHLEEAETNNDGSECIKKEPLEEGEIEDDEFADEGLHVSRSVLPENDLIMTPKRKRRRKTKVLKKRKLNHTASFEGTMKDNHNDGTFQLDGHELLVQGKYPAIFSNDTPSTNRDECLACSDSSWHCSDPNNDKEGPKIYNICRTFRLGIKKPLQKNIQCKQKKLVRKIGLEKRLCKNGPLNSKLKTKLRKFCPKNKTNRRLCMHPQFPCNFSHTGVRCITGDHCKFMNEEFRETLKSLHEQLRTAPKKINSNFPQLIRDGEAAVMCTKNCHNKSTKKIPSLLEMDVPIPPQFLAKERNFTVNGEQSSSLKKEAFSNIQQRDISSFVACSDPNLDQMQQILGGKKKKLLNEKEQPIVFNRQNYLRGRTYDCISAVSSLTSKSYTEENQTGTEDNSANILPHSLPKIQQELFLRIQQKQRQPLNLKNRHLGDLDKTRNEEDTKETVNEQNWYSSEDDDDSSLVDVLRNLPRLQSFPSKANISSINTPISDTYSSSSMIESSGKPLCSVRELPTKSVPSPQICEKFHTMIQILASHSKENIKTPVLMNSPIEKTVASYSSLGNASTCKAAIESCHGGGAGVSTNGSSIVDFGNIGSVRQDKSLQTKIKKDIHSVPLMSYFSTVSNKKICRDSVLGKDMDIREVVEMPLRPTSLHKPAVEISASLNSHAPIMYKLIPITVPLPNYFGLRACIPRDPRLHRTFGLYKGANMSRVITTPCSRKN